MQLDLVLRLISDVTRQHWARFGLKNVAQNDQLKLILHFLYKKKKLDDFVGALGKGYCTFQLVVTCQACSTQVWISKDALEKSNQCSTNQHLSRAFRFTMATLFCFSKKSIKMSNRTTFMQGGPMALMQYVWKKNVYMQTLNCFLFRFVFSIFFVHLAIRPLCSI